MSQWLQQYGLPVGALLAVAFLVSGCTNEPPLPPLFPVKGTIKVDGNPLTAGQIRLVAETPDSSGKVPPSSGQINSSGEYEIFAGGKSGAPKGKYKVGITPPMVPAEGAKGPPSAPYNEKYRDPSKSGLEINVTESGGGYDLKLTK